MMRKFKKFAIPSLLAFSLIIMYGMTFPSSVSAGPPGGDCEEYCCLGDLDDTCFTMVENPSGNPCFIECQAWWQPIWIGGACFVYCEITLGDCIPYWGPCIERG